MTVTERNSFNGTSNLLMPVSYLASIHKGTYFDVAIHDLDGVSQPLADKPIVQWLSL